MREPSARGNRPGVLRGLDSRRLEDEELHHGPEDKRDAGEREREPDEESDADAASAVVLHALGLGTVVLHTLTYRHRAATL